MLKKENSMPNFSEMEEQTLKFWQQNNCFEKLMKKNENSEKTFRFLDGPITANYEMGIHHVWGRTLKDLFLKYKSLQGFKSMFQNGFDAHGLPVENGVEKELGINSKKEILELGLDKFVEACMKRVDKFSNVIKEQSIRMGQWMDWNNNYYTNTDENITAIWHFLKVCDQNGWIVEDGKVLQWCPRCGTSLSEHEMTGCYKDLEHMAVFFKLPIKNENSKILVWTTTPWTLSSNVAVAVNPENEYLKVKVKSDSDFIIVGKEALKVLKDDAIKVVETFKGEKLVGKEYETCFADLPLQNFEHKIVAWKEVSAVEGSGAVHIAPGCGAEDNELGKSLNLPVIVPIDENGVFYNNFGFLSGKKASEVADEVFEKLKEQNKLYYTHKFKHSYPVCWRCKEPIVFRMASSWWIKVDQLRDRLLKASETVKWEPDFMGKRMTDWLNNMGDWNISRKRFYGIPLPIYKCECGHVHVVGSLKELEELSSRDEVAKLPHLHRPYIDEIKITCPKCGRKVERIPDVGDCWLDAGITPFSTKKYFTDKAFFEQNFPSEVVIEMREQVRLWFYSMLFMSVVLEDKAPYERVVAHESVIQESGARFSKSGFSIKVNDDLMKRLSADVCRYLFVGNPLTSDVRFGYNLGDEVKRKLLNFWNIYFFYNTYAVLDNPIISEIKSTDKLNFADKWLVSLVNEFVKNSEKNFDDFKAFNVIKDFEKLVDDISNFYIRINRRRFWKAGDLQDKNTAYSVLYYAIKNIIVVMSPIIPFLCEYIWQNLVRESENEVESIFLTKFPKYNVDFEDEKLLNEVQIVRDVITVALSLRNENNLKIKQPLSTMFLKLNEQDEKAVENFENIVKEELNIKTIKYVKNETQFNDVYFTLNFREAGAVLKGDVQKVKNLLEQINDFTNLNKQFESGIVNIEEFKNLPSKLFIKNFKPKKEFVVAVDNSRTIVLDTTLTPELIQQGLVREFIRNIQILRKEADFNIEDRIDICFVNESENLKELIKLYLATIKEEILAVDVVEKMENAEYQKMIEIGSDTPEIKIRRHK